MEKFIKTVEGIDIYFEALEENISLSELLPEETKEQLQEIEDNNIIFCAKVTAKVNGIGLADDYLGGCIYESEEDFYTRYENDYFSDMVNNVVSEAKKEIPKMIEELTKVIL